MTYAEAIQYLYDLQLFGTQPGLENTRELADLCGAPDRQLRFIHVAGTNGKGSVCAMLASIYQAAGLRVGLYTSPHLVAFGERIQVNHQPISEADVIRLVTGIQPLLAQFSQDHHPTFFEVVTVMALQYFAEQQCDLVIWETGLGGRLDATNIVTPELSIITNVSLEHTDWLGDTLAKIAFEKAGIIKPGIPVLTATEAREVLTVIQETATQKHAPLTRVDSTAWSGFTQKIPLLGAHQQINAATACAAIELLQTHFPVSKEAIESGFAKVHWPGRLQLAEPSPGRKVLLDGAHNEDGMTILCRALKNTFSEEKPTLIIGALSDKNWRSMCQLIAPLCAEIHLVPVASQRSAKTIDLLPTCQAANSQATVFTHESLEDALQQTREAPFRLITGSLYLVGEAMERLSIAAVPSADERGLNEWAGRKTGK